MNPRFTVFLVLAFIIGFAGIASAQMLAPEERFAASLTDYTASKPVIVDDIPDDEEDLEGVKSVAIHRFKSKKPVSTNPDTFATLALIILEYEDAASAGAALGKVPAGAEEEMRKAPELDFVSGARLFRLIGACVLSDESWKAVEKKLTDAVFGDGKNPEQWARIACGGNVTVSAR